jgi:uncharacterized protein YbaR (Trm112 family)
MNWGKCIKCKHERWRNRDNICAQCTRIAALERELESLKSQEVHSNAMAGHVMSSLMEKDKKIEELKSENKKLKELCNGYYSDQARFMVHECNGEVHPWPNLLCSIHRGRKSDFNVFDKYLKLNKEMERSLKLICCPECKGNGIQLGGHNSILECSMCRGNGFLSVQKHSNEIEKLKKELEIERSKKPCPKCKGSGEIYKFEDWQDDCDECGGSGRISKGTKDVPSK